MQGCSQLADWSQSILQCFLYPICIICKRPCNGTDDILANFRASSITPRKPSVNIPMISAVICCASSPAKTDRISANASFTSPTKFKISADTLKIPTSFSLMYSLILVYISTDAAQKVCGNRRPYAQGCICRFQKLRCNAFRQPAHTS